MPNSTVRANAEGLPTLNRRSALAKLGLGLAATTSLAATAIAAPDAGVSPELLRLIDAHKAAFAADKEAEHRRGETEEAYIAARPATRIPLYDLYGKAERKKERLLEMSLGLDECKKHEVSPACCAIKAVPLTPPPASSRSTIASPRVSVLPISSRRKSYWMTSALLDTADDPKNQPVVAHFGPQLRDDHLVAVRFEEAARSCSRAVLRRSAYLSATDALILLSVPLQSRSRSGR